MRDFAEVEAVETFTGKVKWFSTARDYGFVVCERTQKEALLHGNLLRENGLETVCANWGVRGTAVYTAKGLQLRKINAVDIDTLMSDANSSAKKYDSADFEAAKVKWYDPELGYGFARLHNNDGDFLIRASVLKRAGMDSVETGQAISVVATSDDQGKVIAAIRSWI